MKMCCRNLFISVFPSKCLKISRRFQKIFEEGPPTIAKKDVFHEMERAGMRLTALVGYQGALQCRNSFVKFQ
jgi:acetyl-CoA carboxylase/biotin carboxylase 1